MTTSVLRIRSASGGMPLGAVFLGVGAVGAATVGLLRLDHLPFAVCVFKALSGLPCPTCGTTRALARLFFLDVPGSFAMNPLAALGAIMLLAWGALDLLLLPARRVLVVDVSEGFARGLRIAAVLAIVANWAFLIAAGR